MPWFAVWLLAVAFMSWAAASFYSLFLNPEISFYRTAARVKHAWARQLPRESGPRVIFAGGSSCLTSINTLRLLERNVRALNMGMGAGFGAKFLARFALSEVRPGDTLVLALEPDLLMRRLDDPAMAVQLSYSLSAPELLSAPGSPPPSRVRAALALRPGAYHVFTLIGKLIGGRPLYRYNVAELSPCGWQHVPLRWNFAAESPYKGQLSDDARKFFASLRDWCASNDVRLAYSMPWSYVPAREAREFREQSRNLLLQIAAYMPVLKDPSLGAYCVREHFTDTALHLDSEGAALRTDSVAQQLTSWSVWSSAELAELRFSDGGVALERAALASSAESALKKEN